MKRAFQKQQVSRDLLQTEFRPERDDSVACEMCGVFGAFAAGGRFLCLDCYTGAGSCCPEFGKDDLWSMHDQKAP